MIAIRSFINDLKPKIDFTGRKRYHWLITLSYFRESVQNGTANERDQPSTARLEELFCKPFNQILRDSGA